MHRRPYCSRSIQSPWCAEDDHAGEGGRLEQYVNDRSYSANSFLSVSIGRMFTSDLGAGAKIGPDLALDTQAMVSTIRKRAVPSIIRA